MKTKGIISLLAVLLAVIQAIAQNSVGINTANPNQNAVLHLVSPTNNQGLLIPRLNTSQRLQMSTNLGNNEGGLFVFDTDMKNFFFWDGYFWNTSNLKNYYAGNGIKIINDSIINITPDIPITLTGTGNISVLGNYPNYTIHSITSDNQILSFDNNFLSISNGNSIDLSSLINDADNDPTNELNTSFAIDQNLLTITDAGGSKSVDLSAFANTDNQILNFQPSTNILSISNGNSIDLSSLINDADNDPTNELNTSFAIDQNLLTITDAGGPKSVDLSTFANTDNQILNFQPSTNILSISNGNSIDLSSLINDADNDPTNETNQTLNLIGTVLNITDASGTLSVELSSLINDADASSTNELNTNMYYDEPTYTLYLEDAGGIILSTNLYSLKNDADASPTNEIQSLSLNSTTNVLSLSLSAPTVNLSAYKQDLSMSGNVLSLTGDLTPVNLSATIPSNGQVLTWNGTLNQWESKPPILAGKGITIDESNKINGLWESSPATGIITTNSLSNVGIGGNSISDYKLNVNGRIQTISVNQLSDKKWIDDIKPIQGSLEKIQKLQGVTFSWKTKEFPDKNFPTGTNFGLIAQQVEPILPFAVNTDQNGNKSIQYSHLIAILIEAIKEQQSEIEHQKNEIELLKKNNDRINECEKEIITIKNQMKLLQSQDDKSNKNEK